MMRKFRINLQKKIKNTLRSLTSLASARSNRSLRYCIKQLKLTKETFWKGEKLLLSVKPPWTPPFTLYLHSNTPISTTVSPIFPPSYTLLHRSFPSFPLFFISSRFPLVYSFRLLRSLTRYTSVTLLL